MCPPDQGDFITAGWFIGPAPSPLSSQRRSSRDSFVLLINDEKHILHNSSKLNETGSREKEHQAPFIPIKFHSRPDSSCWRLQKRSSHSHTLKLAVRNPIRQLSIISFRDFWYKIRTRPPKGTGPAPSSVKADQKREFFHFISSHSFSFPGGHFWSLFVSCLFKTRFLKRVLSFCLRTSGN